jgi:hypothetical protein
MYGRRLSLSSAFAMALVAGACVTINIYFPAAAAERVADRIIDEVYQLKPDAPKPKPGEAATPK